jgi:hypothetical protein
MTQTQILEWVRSPPRMAGGAQEKIGAISPQTILYSPTAAPKSLRPPPAMPFSAPDARIELIGPRNSSKWTPVRCGCN